MKYNKIKCEIIRHPLSPHVQQIYTGYLMLHKRGLLDLSVVPHEKNKYFEAIDIASRNCSEQHLDVILNGHIHLHYDTQDGFAFDEACLECCDFYYKRSYYPRYLDTLDKHRVKIYPLGLNYLVYPDFVDKFFMNSLVKSLDAYNLIKFTPRLRYLEALPDLDAESRILFMCHAYDPYQNDKIPKIKVEERINNNETRANCIKLLREHFGEKFYGGFTISEFTLKNYKEYIVDDKRLTRKELYLKHMKSYPICIATTGLHGSIGWKFAEYVAHAKAILSEKLNYAVTGNLEINKNYITFDNPDECVEKAEMLMTDLEHRNEIMLNNARYYQCWLRPDNLVLNTILLALSRR